jgi:hypothetical protein
VTFREFAAVFNPKTEMYSLLGAIQSNSLKILEIYYTIYTNFRRSTVELIVYVRETRMHERHVS